MAVAPPPVRCPRCSADVGGEQDWCLSCGAAARTRLARTPNWRMPTAVLVVIVLIAGGALAVAFAALTDDNGRGAGPQTVPSVAAASPDAPAAAAAPATTAPAPTAAPTSTAAAPTATTATRASTTAAPASGSTTFTIPQTTTTLVPRKDKVPGSLIPPP